MSYFKAWIAFCVLTERDQYTFSTPRFFFDVFRFAVMFALLMWAFLSEKPGQYHVFIFGIAFYHALMVIWYLVTIITLHQGATFSFKRDLAPHVIPFIVYSALGIYYRTSAAPLASPTDILPDNHVSVVLLTTSIIVTWCIWRLRVLKNRLVVES